jgi:hypothetical protein
MDFNHIANPCQAQGSLNKVQAVQAAEPAEPPMAEQGHRQAAALDGH